MASGAIPLLAVTLKSNVPGAGACRREPQRRSRACPGGQIRRRIVMGSVPAAGTDTNRAEPTVGWPGGESAVNVGAIGAIAVTCSAASLMSLVGLLLPSPP